MGTSWSWNGELLRVHGEGIDRCYTFDESTGEMSDGNHTFEELYRYRKLYHAMLANWLWLEGSDRFDIHKSWRHSDGEECFGGGWFVVMMTLPTGQVSNHYPAEDWDLFRIPSRETAAEWDGHTPEEAADRLEREVRGRTPDDWAWSDDKRLRKDRPGV